MTTRWDPADVDDVLARLRAVMLSGAIRCQGPTIGLQAMDCQLAGGHLGPHVYTEPSNGLTVMWLIGPPAASPPPECRRLGPGGYICSEPKGHAGQHIARGLDGRAVSGWNSP